MIKIAPKQALSKGLLITLWIAFNVVLAWGAPYDPRHLLSANDPASPMFSMSMNSALDSVDPALMRGNGDNPVHFLIHKSLYRYDNKSGLVPELAEKCQWQSPLKLLCTLIYNAKWSDGSKITADDIVRGHRRLFDPQLKSTQHDLLENIKGYDKASQQPTALGIQSLSENKILYEFSQPDPEFLFKLTHPSLSPVHKSSTFKYRDTKGLITSGAYILKKWEVNKPLLLTANPYFYRHSVRRPQILIHHIEEDSTALNMFDLKKIDFLSRVGISDISTQKHKPDFHFIPVVRNDYIGFAPKTLQNPFFIKALAHAIDYAAMAKLLSAKGRPGCMGMPPLYMYPNPPCVNFDLKKAQEYWRQVPQKLKDKTYRFAYSLVGGESVRTSMAWIQSQWKNNLGLKIELVPMEGRMYIAALKSPDGPDFFRKGLAPDRPTCLGALEFLKKGHHLNYIGYDNPQFEKALSGFNGQTKSLKERKLCHQLSKQVLESWAMIPLGEIHFSIRVNPKFKGWKVNELNQIYFDKLFYNNN